MGAKRKVGRPGKPDFADVPRMLRPVEEAVYTLRQAMKPIHEYIEKYPGVEVKFFYTSYPITLGEAIEFMSAQMKPEDRARLKELGLFGKKDEQTCL